MKRKTLAILLAIALVVSAVTILAACSKEYKITFRNYNSAPMDKLTTVKGKVTYTKDNLTMDDRVFAGWYDAATGGNKVDLETTVFKKDTTLYAHWTLIGESVGYCIPGVINGKTNWDLTTVVTDTARKLAHQDGTNVYTMTDLVLKQGDSFKVVSAVPAATGDWAGNVKIEAGYSQMDVEIAQDATLPDDVDGSDTEVLIGAGDTNNIAILRNMKIDLRFEYGETSEDCVIKITIKEASGAALAPVEEVGYMIAGTFSTWNGPISSDDETLAKFIMTPNADKTQYTVTGMEVKRRQAFTVKVNEGIWDRGAYRYSVMDLTVADAVIIPDGKTQEDLFSASIPDGNIVANYDVTVNVTFDAETKRVAVEVTAADFTEQKSDSELGYFVVCTPNNFYNADTVAKEDETNGKYVMSVDANNDKVFAVENIVLEALQKFRTKLNVSGWECTQYNYTNAKFVTGTGVTLPEGITAAGELFNDVDGVDHNIQVKEGYNVTLSLSIDTSAKTEQLTVTVTAVSTVAVTPIDEIGFSLVGTINSWNPADTTKKLTETAEGSKVYTISGVQLDKNAQFKIKVCEEDNWARGSWNALGTITADEGVTLPEGVTEASALFTPAANADGNITVNYALTATITLDRTNADVKINIVVTAITAE